MKQFMSVSRVCEEDEEEDLLSVVYTVELEKGSLCDQMDVFLRALEVYAERNEFYKDNWKRMGWRGQLIRIRERAERLWDSLWDEEPDALGRIRKSDDAIDLINFGGFLVRGVEEENRDGSWW